MSRSDTIPQIVRNRHLASLGDAFVNFVYSLALTLISGRPQGVKVSDRVLAEAFRLAGLREVIGTRITRKDLANASEALLAEAYCRDLLTIEDSVKLLSQHPDGPTGGLSDLLKLAAERLDRR